MDPAAKRHVRQTMKGELDGIQIVELIYVLKVNRGKLGVYDQTSQTSPVKPPLFTDQFKPPGRFQIIANVNYIISASKTVIVLIKWTFF